MKRTTTLIAEDEPLASEGLAGWVREMPELELVGIRADAATEGARLGYWLGRPFWGRGLATEAAEAMVHAYFAYAGGSVLSADARAENPASRRVLEKVGFVRTGTATDYVPVRGCDLTSDRFRLDRAAWSARFGVSGCDRAA